MTNRHRMCMVALLVASLLPVSAARGQEPFSEFQTPHLRVRHQPGITGEEARKVSDYLEEEHKYLQKILGMETAGRIEVRVYSTEQRFRAGTGLKHATDVVTLHSVLFVPPPGVLEQRGQFAQSLSLALSTAFLEPSLNNGAPLWLVHSFAVYQSGKIPDMRMPVGWPVQYFSDLDQEIRAYGDGGPDERLEYFLGMTMKYFVDSFGEEKAFGLFRRFDGRTPVEQVFSEALGKEYPEVERSWAASMANLIDDGSGRKTRGN